LLPDIRAMIRITETIGMPDKPIPDWVEKDILDLDWFDTSKTIIRKTTRKGREVGIRKSSTPLEDGELLFLDEKLCIQVNIKATHCIVFRPDNHKDMGVISFEIGNKHIPIFINEVGEVIVEFENPLYRLLDRFGYQPKIETRKLLKTHALKMNRHKALIPTKVSIKDNLKYEPAINITSNQ
jgi:urease accessory protein